MTKCVRFSNEMPLFSQPDAFVLALFLANRILIRMKNIFELPPKSWTITY